MGDYSWARAGAGVGAVTWALAGGAAWLLIVATADGADHPVPVAAGMLLGLVLGQATAFELLVGMAGAALVAAVDPLDAAAAALSVLMAAAVVVAIIVGARRPQAEPVPEPRFDSFI